MADRAVLSVAIPSPWLPKRGQHRVLIADTDEVFASGLATNLELEGYGTQLVHHIPDVLEAIEAFDPHLIILDMSPCAADHGHLLHRLRQVSSQVPVLVVSAHTAEPDRVAALRMGADDYIAKPPSLLELLERIRIHITRSMRFASSDRLFFFGDMCLDVQHRRVMKAGAPVNLTRREFQVLVTLASASGRPVSREQLLAEVWGFRRAAATRALDFQVRELRRKLEDDPSRPAHILTTRGFGYQLLAGPR